MCGICGYINFDRELDAGDGRIIDRMNSKILHRGPDAQDILLFENIALGFSRLSIIGIDNGMQPIFNEDRSLILICNGEIFNYIELKRELLKRGHQFRTDTDVEVIIHLYEEKGTNFLNELNGQFAFALYDKNKRQMFCARDQLGIVPFYFTSVQNTFIFGSEIKAILEHPFVVPSIDLVGLDQIFTFAGLVSPRTMFKNINSLENGHFILVDHAGNITKKEYWDIYYPIGNIEISNRSEESYVDELEALLEESIKLRLRSDVDTGFYLSGGLDSSVIAMMASKMVTSGRKNAFSIDFYDRELSEGNFQELIARAGNLKLNQQTFFLTDIYKRIEQAIYHCECPIKETYNTASLALSESVKAKNIKVVLSGEGADELFAGYVGYRFDKLRLANEVKNEYSTEEGELRAKVWGDESFFYEVNFSDFTQLKKSLYSNEVRASYSLIDCLNYPIINKDRIAGRDILNKRSYVDYKIRLVDHMVSDHGDRMALANSIEARYPFLDKNLVEFSALVPTELKLNDFTEKYIIRKMATKYVPKEVCEREKFHFVAPGSPFLLQSNIEYINDILSYSQIKRQGYFNPDIIEMLKKKYSQKGFVVNAPYETDLMIIVITFGILLDQFINKTD